MAFFENIGKKVGGAAQAAAKKSGELVEVTKLNVSIGTEEDKIEKLYAQMGKLIYEKYITTGTADEELVEICEQIKVHEDSIKALRSKIAEIKQVKSCSNCGAEMAKDQVFCAECGTKNEVELKEFQAADSAPSEITCPSCNSSLPAGSLFCTNCGEKLSE
jgi:DNA-directed RNA polymerase subunit RPC12/RpoP